MLQATAVVQMQIRAYALHARPIRRVSSRSACLTDRDLRWPFRCFCFSESLLSLKSLTCYTPLAPRAMFYGCTYRHGKTSHKLAWHSPISQSPHTAQHSIAQHGVAPRGSVPRTAPNREELSTPSRPPSEFPRLPSGREDSRTGGTEGPKRYIYIYTHIYIYTYIREREI